MPTTLILMMVGLLFLLVTLVFVYVWTSRSKVTPADQNRSTETLDTLIAIVQNRSSREDDLVYAIDRILARHGSIEAQNFERYERLIIELCVHPNTASKLILRFEKTLRSLNPEYAGQIERALAQGLAQRG